MWLLRQLATNHRPVHDDLRYVLKVKPLFSGIIWALVYVYSQLGSVLICHYFHRPLASGYSSVLWSLSVPRAALLPSLPVNIISVHKANKVSGFWSCRLQNRCGDALFYFFCQIVKYLIHVDAVIGTRPNYTQSMVAKRGLTNRANIHTPM